MRRFPPFEGPPAFAGNRVPLGPGYAAPLGPAHDALDGGRPYNDPLTRQRPARISAGFTAEQMRTGESRQLLLHESDEWRTLALMADRNQQFIADVALSIDGATQKWEDVQVGDTGTALAIPAGTLVVNARCGFAPVAGQGRITATLGAGAPLEYRTQSFPVLIDPTKVEVPTWAYAVTITAPNAAFVSAQIGLATWDVQANSSLTIGLPFVREGSFILLPGVPFLQVSLIWRHRR